MNSRFITACSTLIALAWVINFALWIGLVYWVATQPSALRDIDSGQFHLNSALSLAGEPITANYRPYILISAMIASALSGMAMLISVIIGTKQFRTVRTWMMLIVAVGAWLSLWLGIDDLHWRGQQYRTARDLQELSVIAEDLHEDWPTNDGDRETLGPFLAYPKPNPTTLLLIGTPRLPGTDLKISSVERTPSGVIRFELASGEQPSWLEWQPNGSEPSEFISGLSTRYRVDRFAKLEANWYLVHYRNER